MTKAAMLAAMAGFGLAGCAPDIDTFGTVPPLSPVGSGLTRSEAAAAVADMPAFNGTSVSWVGGDADYFRDVRARRDGDLITVRIAINDRASLNNSSNRSRKAAAGADLGFTYDLMGIVGADVNGNGDVNSNSSAAGQGSTTRSERIELSIAAIVTKVLPNGFLVIEGIIRPGDISPDNTISYEKIAEARISYGGRGRLTEAQQPGWTQQIWDRISPF
jgi:flagellar L-ring protein precursor FlgH